MKDISKMQVKELSKAIATNTKQIAQLERKARELESSIIKLESEAFRLVMSEGVDSQNVKEKLKEADTIKANAQTYLFQAEELKSDSRKLSSELRIRNEKSESESILRYLKSEGLFNLEALKVIIEKHK